MAKVNPLVCPETRIDPMFMFLFLLVAIDRLYTSVIDDVPLEYSWASCIMYAVF